MTAGPSSQFPSHSSAFAGVRDRLSRRGRRRDGPPDGLPEHGREDLESVLGATPHEFESRILRHSPRGNQNHVSPERGSGSRRGQRETGPARFRVWSHFWSHLGSSGDLSGARLTSSNCSPSDRLRSANSARSAATSDVNAARSARVTACDSSSTRATRWTSHDASVACLKSIYA
jgi:hypothetical protein